MGKHGDSWGLCFDFCHRGKFLHVSDAIDDGVNLSSENVAMSELAFGTSYFNLPSWVEEV
jgi:hypothetical protein